MQYIFCISISLVISIYLCIFTTVYYLLPAYYVLSTVNPLTFIPLLSSYKEGTSCICFGNGKQLLWQHLGL